MRANGETRRKLEHVPDGLEKEFPEEPPNRVEREVDVVSDQLLRGARFPDYVPLLVHRFVRERLLDRGARRRSAQMH